jgi:hypothetical protein
MGLIADNRCSEQANETNLQPFFPAPTTSTNTVNVSENIFIFHVPNKEPAKRAAAHSPGRNELEPWGLKGFRNSDFLAPARKWIAMQRFIV